MSGQDVGRQLGRGWARLPKVGRIVVGLLAVGLIARCVMPGDAGNSGKSAAEAPVDAVAAQASAAALQRERTLAANEPVVQDASQPARARLDAIGRIAAVAPDRIEAMEPLRVKLQAEVDREFKAAAAKISAMDAAQRKTEGVKIGMRTDEVLASSWGKPRSVNRTTGPNGVVEQWVYGGGNYLYFTNGKLTVIQN